MLFHRLGLMTDIDRILLTGELEETSATLLPSWRSSQSVSISSPSPSSHTCTTVDCFDMKLDLFSPAVAKRKSLFDDKAAEIDELTYIVKQVRVIVTFPSPRTHYSVCPFHTVICLCSLRTLTV